MFDIITDWRPEGRTIEAAMARLCREPGDRVRRAFHAMRKRREALSPYGAEAGQGRCRIAARERRRRRPLVQRDRVGLTLGEVADEATKMAGMLVDSAAIRALLIHHGYLEMAPFGGRQRRTLCTDPCVAAEYGHNVHAPGAATGMKGSRGRIAPFPVLYREHLPGILWTLGLDQIRDSLLALSSKRERLAWLTTNHDHLPAKTIAVWSGVCLRSAEGVLARVRCSRSSAEGGALGTPAAGL
jgi:hypothetical protein